VEKPESAPVPKNWRKGGYIEKGKIPKDPWGNDFVYLSPGAHGDYDIIFMDISMPGMDGREAAREIRALEGAAHVPICALTAHAMEGDSEGILAAGIDHYLTKPLKKREITERILSDRPADARPPAIGQPA